MTTKIVAARAKIAFVKTHCRCWIYSMTMVQRIKTVSPQEKSIASIEWWTVWTRCCRFAARSQTNENRLLRMFVSGLAYGEGRQSVSGIWYSNRHSHNFTALVPKRSNDTLLPNSTAHAKSIDTNGKWEIVFHRKMRTNLKLIPYFGVSFSQL